MPYSDRMSFTERWYNTVLTAYDWFVRHFDYLPAEEATARKYFAHLAPLPPLDDLLRNISLTLVNSHRALSPPRPSMPSIMPLIHFHSIPEYQYNFLLSNSFALDVIPIGGAHIEAAKPLPNDLQTFLDGAKHGAIYFSLGSVLQSSMLPKELIRSFVGEFLIENILHI